MLALMACNRSIGFVRTGAFFIAIQEQQACN
jgi:hypothetical protein